MRNIIDSHLDLLRVFHRTARHESMTAAANILCITQPAVSRAIGILEDNLGCRLFNRSKRKLSLTQEGKILYRKVDQSFKLLNEAQKQIENIQELTDGVIDIGSTHVLMRYFLMRHISAFHRDYPNVKLRIKTQNMLELIQMQAQNEMDFSVVATPTMSTEHFDPSFEVIPLQTYRYLFIADRRHFGDLQNRQLSLEELNSYPLIMLRNATQTREYVERAFAERNLTPNVAFECDMMSMVVDFTRHGFGFGLVITPVFEQARFWGMDLIEVPLTTKFPPGLLVLIRKHNAELSKPAEILINNLKVNS